MTEPTGVLVIGAHRSGTSAIARTLGLMGAAEAARLLPPNAANPSGYWEAEAIVAANDRFLAAVGSRWDDPRPLPAAAFAGRAAAVARAELARALEADFAGRPLFVVKDPRFCRTAPLMLAAVAAFGARAQVVIPLRPPAQAVRSLQTRDGFSRARCVAVWLGGVLQAEALTRAARRGFVGYDRFLADPLAGARGLAAGLDGFTPGAADGAAAQIIAYWCAAEPRSAAEALGDDPLAALAEQVYARLAATLDGALPDAGAMDEAAARFARLLRSAAWRRAALGDSLRELSGRIAWRASRL